MVEANDIFKIKEACIQLLAEKLFGEKVKVRLADDDELRSLDLPVDFEYRQNDIHIIEGRNRRELPVFRLVQSTYIKPDKKWYGDHLLNKDLFEMLRMLDDDRVTSGRSIALGLRNDPDKNDVFIYCWAFLKDIEKDRRGGDKSIRIKTFDTEAGDAYSVRLSYSNWRQGKYSDKTTNKTSKRKKMTKKGKRK